MRPRRRQALCFFALQLRAHGQCATPVAVACDQATEVTDVINDLIQNEIEDLKQASKRGDVFLQLQVAGLAVLIGVVALGFRFRMQ